MGNDGKITSEFKMSMIGMVVGAILEGAGHSLTRLNEIGVFTGSISIVMGAIVQIITILGYTLSRTSLKKTLIQSDALKSIGLPKEVVPEKKTE